MNDNVDGGNEGVGHFMNINKASSDSASDPPFYFQGLQWWTVCGVWC